MSIDRRRLLTLLGASGAAAGLSTVAGGIAAAQPSPSAPPPDSGTGAVPEVQPEIPPPADWRAVAEDVRNEVRGAWRSYVDRAFGHDQIKPVSGGFEEFFVPDHPV